MAQYLAKFEDGPAVLFTAWSTRRLLRHVEHDAHGNRDFCVDGVNCLIPEPTVESVSGAIGRLLAIPRCARGSARRARDGGGLHLGAADRPARGVPSSALTDLLGDRRRRAVEHPEAETRHADDDPERDSSRAAPPIASAALGAVGSITAWRICWMIDRERVVHDQRAAPARARDRLDRVEDRRRVEQRPCSTTSQIGCTSR